MFHKTDAAQKHSFSVLDRGKNLQLRSQLLLGCLLSLDAQLSQLLPPLIGNLGLLFPLLLKFLIEQTKGNQSDTRTHTTINSNVKNRAINDSNSYCHFEAVA